MAESLESVERELIRGPLQDLPPVQQMDAYRSWAIQNRQGFAQLSSYEQAETARKRIEEIGPSSLMKMARFIPILGPTLGAASSKAESYPLIGNLDSAPARTILTVFAEAAMMFGAVKVGQIAKQAVGAAIPSFRATSAVAQVTGNIDQAMKWGASAANAQRLSTVAGGVVETATDAMVFTAGQSLLNQEPPSMIQLAANTGFIGAVKLGVFGASMANNAVRDHQVASALRQQNNPNLKDVSNYAGTIARAYMKEHKVDQNTFYSHLTSLLDGKAGPDVGLKFGRTLAKNPGVMNSDFGRILLRQLAPVSHPVSYPGLATDPIEVAFEKLKDPQGKVITGPGIGEGIGIPSQQRVSPKQLQELVTQHNQGDIRIHSVKGSPEEITAFELALPRPKPLPISQGASVNPHMETYVEQTWSSVMGKKPAPGKPLYEPAPGTTVLPEADYRGVLDTSSDVVAIRTRMNSGELFRVRRDPQGVVNPIPPAIKAELMNRETLFHFGDDPETFLVSTPLKTPLGEEMVKLEEVRGVGRELLDPEDFQKYITEGSLVPVGLRSGPVQKSNFGRLAYIRSQLGLPNRRVLDLSETKQLLEGTTPTSKLVGKEVPISPLGDPLALLALQLEGKAVKVGNGVRLKFPQMEADYPSAEAAWGALRELHGVRLEEARIVGLVEQAMGSRKWPSLPVPDHLKDLAPVALFQDEMKKELGANMGRFTTGRLVPKIGPILDAGTRLARSGQPGIDLHASLEDYIDLTDGIYGAPMHEVDRLLSELEKFDIEGFKGLSDHIRFGVEISPKSMAVAKRLNQIAQGVSKLRADSGLTPLEIGPDFFPPVWDWDQLNGLIPHNPTQPSMGFPEMVAELGRKYGLSAQEGKFLLDEMVKDTTRDMGSVANPLWDKIRKELPGAVKDPRVAWTTWLHSNASAIAKAKVFGPTEKLLNDKIALLDSQDRTWAADLADELFGRNKDTLHPFLKQVKDFQSVKLALAAIPNLFGQHLNPAMRVGLLKTWGSWRELFKPSNILQGESHPWAVNARRVGALAVKGQERIERDGLWSALGGKALWDEGIQTLGGRTLKVKEKVERLSGHMLALSERLLRSVATELGRDDVERLLKEVDAGRATPAIYRQLEEYRFDLPRIQAMQRNPILRELAPLLGGKNLSDNANFKFNLLTLPSGAFKGAPKVLGGPVGQIGLQYKSYLFSQTRFMHYELSSGWREGDWKRTAKALAYLAVAFPAFGLAAHAATNAIKGTPDFYEKVEKAMDDPTFSTLASFYVAGLVGAGGLGILQQASLEVLSRDEYGTKVMLVPPVAQTTMNLGMGLSALGQSLSGDKSSFDEATRRLLRELGPTGRAYENWVLGKKDRSQ